MARDLVPAYDGPVNQRLSSLIYQPASWLGSRSKLQLTSFR
jgi:hypothetical protein